MRIGGLLGRQPLNISVQVAASPRRLRNYRCGNQGAQRLASAAVAGGHQAGTAETEHFLSEISCSAPAAGPGRRAVAEAVARGHRVTAVVRDPAAHQALAGTAWRWSGATPPTPARRRLAAGHDAAIGAVARSDPPPDWSFRGRGACPTRRPGPGRGRPPACSSASAPRWRSHPGVTVLDTPGFSAGAGRSPSDTRPKSAALRARRRCRGLAGRSHRRPSCWTPRRLAPAGYRVGGTRWLRPRSGVLFPYADLAAALVDEIEAPKHHRTLVAAAP